MLDRYDQDLMLDYLEGELDGDRRAQLDAQLEQDPQLAALLREMAKDRDALRSLPQAEAPTDLVHDVTQTLERRMLLDDTVDDAGPIPLARGRGLAGEPTRSISWGRVVGLTGLAASVALVAGIVVIAFNDPLQRAAEQLADNAQVDSATAVAAVETEAAEAWHGEEATTLDRRESTGLASGAVEPNKPDVLPPHDGVLPGANLAEADHTPADTDALAGTQPPALLPVASTAAITAIPPRQQLVLLTDAPEISREQLFEFCVDNGIPIVEPEQQLSVRQSNSAGLGDERGDKALLDKPAIDADAPDERFAGYALLINAEQLDTLVLDLNTDISIKSKRASKGALFSNQAALIADLPGDAIRDRRKAVLDTGPAGSAGAEDATAATEQQAGQQAIKLRLPADLGSDYADSRNAYNLLAQNQHAGHALVEPDDAAADAGVATDVKKQLVAEDVAKPETAAQLEEGDPRLAEEQDAPKDAPRSDPPLKPDPAPVQTPAPDAADSESEEAQESDRKDAPLIPTVDPTRGNWLAAHLPLADTTPLLLQWRAEQSASPTNLVPVVIQRAAPDEVNTLRFRQQVEFAKRFNKNDAPETDAEASQTPEDAEPTAEPASAGDKKPAHAAATESDTPDTGEPAEQTDPPRTK